MKYLAISAALIAAMSFIAFFTYMADKIKAKNGSWRIRESVLLSLGFLGGALSALLAMTVCRHKTKHWYFWAVNVFSLLLHVAAAIVIYIKLV